jgi:hypothetical protein
MNMAGEHAVESAIVWVTPYQSNGTCGQYCKDSSSGMRAWLMGLSKDPLCTRPGRVDETYSPAHLTSSDPSKLQTAKSHTDSNRANHVIARHFVNDLLSVVAAQFVHVSGRLDGLFLHTQIWACFIKSDRIKLTRSF